MNYVRSGFVPEWKHRRQLTCNRCENKLLGKQILGQSDSPTVEIQYNIEARSVREQQTRDSDEEFIKICDGSLPRRSEKDTAFVESLNRFRDKGTLTPSDHCHQDHDDSDDGECL